MVSHYASAFILGLFGSLHCLGMCGPIALALPAPRGASPGLRVLGRLAYNTGRTFTYAVLGVFAGLLGHVFQLGGVQRIVPVVLGSLLIASVFVTAEHMPRWVFNTFYRPVQRGLGKLMSRKGVTGLLHIGLLNGLLPCGLVYAALAAAATREGPAGGALYMALFGLGTLPMMFALSLGGAALHAPRFRPVMQWLVPSLTVCVGLLLVLQGLSISLPFLPGVAPGACCGS